MASTIPDDRAADGACAPRLDRPEERSQSSMPFGLPRLTADRTVLTTAPTGSVTGPTNLVRSTPRAR